MSTPPEPTHRLAQAACALPQAPDAGIPIDLLRELAEAVLALPATQADADLLELQVWARAFVAEWGGAEFTAALATVERLAGLLGVIAAMAGGQPAPPRQ